MLGIFDSGIGGLTVVKELIRKYPDASFVYLGDTARTPYGAKDKETIQRYAVEDAEFLLERDISGMIVACNTVSAHAIPTLKKRFPNLPIFGVIEPAIKEAISSSKGRIGIIATRATVKSKRYTQLLKKKNLKVRVFEQACPLFVPLAEEGMVSGKITDQIIDLYLSNLKKEKIDTLILGCTHYPMLQKAIATYMGKSVRIIDSPHAVISHIEKTHPELLKKGRVKKQEYFLTDLQTHTKEIAEKWLGRSLQIKRATSSLANSSDF